MRSGVMTGGVSSLCSVLALWHFSRLDQTRIDIDRKILLKLGHSDYTTILCNSVFDLFPWLTELTIARYL